MVEYKVVSGFWKNKYVRCTMLSNKPASRAEWRELWRNIATDILNGKIAKYSGWTDERLFAYSYLHQLMEFRTSQMRKITVPEWLLDETHQLVNEVFAN